jgi:hypothetical protein
MATLYGKTYTRDELSRKTGDLWQLGGVKPVVLDDGPERGVRIAEFRTGGGLNFAVLLDRGMDIGWAEYRGVPLAWQSAAGPVAPAFFEPGGLGWLRGFHGGLVTTCGLTYAGAPCTDEGQELGLHGRISYTPARHVYWDGEWQGDDYLLWAQGEMREAVIFGENIALRRRIWSHLGEKRLFIDDIVANEGYHTTPHMVLYHINIGFPVVDATAELITSPARVRPRDAIAAQGIDRYDRFQEPTPEYAEQVFYHDLTPDADGGVRAALVNPAFRGGRGVGVYVKYRQAELPYFTEWKQMGEGDYVVGMEPANCLVEGRDVDRAAGRLQFLEPGESQEVHLEIGVLASAEEIEDFREATRE